MTDWRLIYLFVRCRCAAPKRLEDTRRCGIEYLSLLILSEGLVELQSSTLELETTESHTYLIYVMHKPQSRWSELQTIKLLEPWKMATYLRHAPLLFRGFLTERALAVAMTVAPALDSTKIEVVVEVEILDLEIFHHHLASSCYGSPLK